VASDYKPPFAQVCHTPQIIANIIRQTFIIFTQFLRGILLEEYAVRIF